MLDFVRVVQKMNNKGILEIYPEFMLEGRSKDLMIRGSSFYAIWDEKNKTWSTDEYDAIRLIDEEVRSVRNSIDTEHAPINVKYLGQTDNGVALKWKHFVKQLCPDNYTDLNCKIIFANTNVRREDYSSIRVNYALEEGSIDSYSQLMDVLYSPEERHKLEWAIGAVVDGASKELQKFIVIYGSAGTGKSTVLNIISMLFDGYWSSFDSSALGSASNAFALEAFKKNPLVGIQQDGDLSKIEDNTKLNSLVSHEVMSINEKYKSAYDGKIRTFLFMGTNKPVKITDAKSGILRRLIDVSPTGNKLSRSQYDRLYSEIKYELGAIAWHCLQVFQEDPGYYDRYIPTSMMASTNYFYNFVEEEYDFFKNSEYVTLKEAWTRYKIYCEESRTLYPYSMQAFREELKNYFGDFKERKRTSDNSTLRSVYSNFLSEKFQYNIDDSEIPLKTSDWLVFKPIKSQIDYVCENCRAQYANNNGTPLSKWAEVDTELRDLDTSMLHYVKVPNNHIVIDFDIKDENGDKNFELNKSAASKWPSTYAELSKSGQGIHLHYIYTGDVSKLSSIYDKDIEVKVFNGNSSLRRKLTLCNDVCVRTISSGLPLKQEGSMVNWDGVKNEKMLRNLIMKGLKKEVWPNTKPSIDYISKVLNDAYESGMHYDVTDMRQAILTFAAKSTHQADACIKIVNKMPFRSDEPSEGMESNDDIILFYDIEVFPNLFVLVYKEQGPAKEPVILINPSSSQIEELVKFKLVGFNCRRYDNHILYARMMGYNNEELYRLSQRIINKSENCFFGEAYNLSYTDVYDFAAAQHKQSLKKFEIEMGIHHQELGLRWDQPVPEEKWKLVGEYCINDVVATEATFDYLKADWTARQILADLAEMTVNDTTNSLTTRIIFGKERHPQSQFNYRNMAEPVYELNKDVKDFLEEVCPEMMAEPHGEAKSLLPYFPGYKFDNGKSIYRGEEIGEGGYVYAEPGMYWNIALLDVASMHPHSAIAECLFGVMYTKAYRDIVEGRVSIKHSAWDEVDNMMNGKLRPYIQKVKDGKMTSGDLADALKTAINSVYGLTAAKFENPFRDSRNIDNIVAKRGALMMVDLKHAVQEKGFTVAHIKTDSIKIPNATPEIISFVMEFGKRYGYTFELESTYEKMCLVNDSVYIAKGKSGKHAGEWIATGAQFQKPFVFKTLFSKEPIKFEDMCETKEVKTALYLDFNEEDENEHRYHYVGKVGSFCPIKAGCGGATLLREVEPDKYSAATDSKGYRWLESEMVKKMDMEDCIDKSLYFSKVDEAKDTISKYGDFEYFVSDDSIETRIVNGPEIIPFK